MAFYRKKRRKAGPSKNEKKVGRAQTAEDNERNALVIATARVRIGVVQIAGLVARRIVPFVQEGQTVAAGDKEAGEGLVGDVVEWPKY